MINKKIITFILGVFIMLLAYSVTNAAQDNSNTNPAQHNHVDPFARITENNASLDLKNDLTHRISIIKVEKDHILVVDGTKFMEGDKFMGGVISKIKLNSFRLKLINSDGTIVKKTINVP